MQGAGDGKLTAGQFAEYGRPYDMAVLGAAAAGWLNVLHAHASHDLLLESVLDYPVPAISWSDRLTGISLSGMRAAAPGLTVMGGIHERNAIGTGPQSIATIAIKVGTPTAPGSPVASPGNSQAKVSWTAPANNGSAITGYIVTPYVSGMPRTPRVFNNTATSEVITGLTNATTYTFKVAAKNAIGTGPQSIATTAIKVGTPTAPTGVTASVGSAAGSAVVHWTAPANNGSAITGYIVTPFLGATALAAGVFNNTATSEVITGLANATTYTFRVAAKNAIGTGPQSIPSNAVTTT